MGWLEAAAAGGALPSLGGSVADEKQWIMIHCMEQCQLFEGVKHATPQTDQR
jgi:hypothetical protein